MEIIANMGESLMIRRTLILSRKSRMHVEDGGDS